MHYVPPLVVSLPRLLADYVTRRDVKLPLSNPAVPASAAHAPHDAYSAHTQDALTPGHGQGGSSKGGALSAMKRALHQADISHSIEITSPPHQLNSETTESAGEFHDIPLLPDSSQTLLDYVRQKDTGNEASAYERKRQVHPRLRWPRLASRGCEAESCLDGISPPMSSRLASPNVSRSALARLPSFEIRPSSDFGTEGLFEMKSFSIDGQIKSSGQSRSSRSGGLTPRAVLLPRSRAHEQCPSGVVSTLHAPQAHAENRSQFASTTSLASTFVNTASHSTLPMSASIMSSSSAQQVDRKWFLRVAPISCLPKEHISKAARRAACQGQENGFDVGGEVGEYLTFESWSLCDDYIESLLGAHCGKTGQSLRGLKYLNLSDNRLTSESILKLMEYGLPENLISLSLVSNGFGEEGGRAVVKLVRRCKRLRELDLSRNSIGDIVVQELCTSLERYCPDLEGLGLGGCNLGTSQKSGEALGELLKIPNLNLKALDLSWNAFQGTGAHAFMKGLYANGGGGNRDTDGKDGVELRGNLRRLNLAWNRLGSGYHVDLRRRKDAETSARWLASVFQDGDTLFHLDLSYNGFIAEDCALLASGLRNNHSLFGIHLVGNAAALDDLGFIIPCFPKEQAKEVDACVRRSSYDHGFAETEQNEAEAGGNFAVHENHVRFMNSCARNVPSAMKLNNPKVARSGNLGKIHLNPSLQSLEPESVQSFSEEDLHMEHTWIDDKAQIQTTADWIKQDTDAVSRNTNCCWICENWVEHKVSYIPGYSGDESSPDDVQMVLALFSIDGYAKPTKLRLVEESPRKSLGAMRRSFSKNLSANPLDQLFESQSSSSKPSSKVSKRVRASSGITLDGRTSLILNADGKVVKWVGVRMLPPTKEPIKVVFLVNDTIVAAQDLTKEKLPIPKMVSLRINPDEGYQTFTFDEVNVLSVGTTAWEMFRRGRHHAVCVLEDPNNRNELTVAPRTVEKVEEQDKPRERWTFQKSTFKDYYRDAQHRDGECFEKDWNLSRLGQLLKEDETRSDLCRYLKQKYINVMLTFWVWALSHAFEPQQAAYVSMSVFRDQLVAMGGMGPGKLIDGKACYLSDPDCIFVAANVINKAKKSLLKIFPENGLTRFQFLEAITRLSFRRFLTRTANSSVAQDCVNAVDQFFSCTAFGDEFVHMRRSLHEALFTEECCITYRDHLETLKGVFDGYKTILSYPGRSGKYISYGAWLELLSDAEVLGEEFPMRKCSIAFAIAKEMHVDVTSDWRHMELSWSEFLVAIGAVVRLQPHWEKDFMADYLDELFSDHIDIAFSKLMDRQPGRSRAIMRNVDAQMQPLIYLLHRLFEEADADKSGSVDLREFRWTLNQPTILEELTQHGLNVSELDMLFRNIDVDGNGEVSMEEITDAFVRIKLALKGLEKAVSYVRQAFNEADTDGNGSLDLQEFHALLEQSAVQKKLQTLGVSADDVRDLFEIIDTDGTGTITVEEVIEGFITLRDPGTRCQRGVKALRQLFEEADADGSGSLDLDQVKDAFERPEVEEKFMSMQLQVPSWSTLFQELDVDGSGDLSWEELEEGMTSYWARSSS
mmetsp:Transcript_117307/g.184520  ORF Transcript_117307/g.184520 Transcript_117307/m.184520 type:complete len:1568 (+) Transcript_117307:87-4790(+)